MLKSQYFSKLRGCVLAEYLNYMIMEEFTSFRYLVNRYFVEQLAQTPVKAVEVQYVNQAFEGDRLPIYACGENRYSIRKDGQLAVNCSFCLAAETETTE